MANTFRIDTADGKSYVGKIQGGFIVVDGVRVPARNVIAADIPNNIQNRTCDLNGHFKLADGTVLGVRGRRSEGIFRDRVWTNWSGEILIYGESIGKEIVVPANQVQRLSPWAHSEPS